MPHHFRFSTLVRQGLHLVICFIPWSRVLTAVASVTRLKGRGTEDSTERPINSRKSDTFSPLGCYTDHHEGGGPGDQTSIQILHGSFE